MKLACVVERFVSSVLRPADVTVGLTDNQGAITVNYRAESTEADTISMSGRARHAQTSDAAYLPSAFPGLRLL